LCFKVFKLVRFQGLEVLLSKGLLEKGNRNQGFMDLIFLVSNNRVFRISKYQVSRFVWFQGFRVPRIQFLGF
jgi:hypothetical protein